MSAPALPTPTATRDWRLHLDALVEALGRIAQYTAGLTAAEFGADTRTYDAVLYQFYQAGRSADRLPDPVRVRASGVDWGALGALRTIADPADPPRSEPRLRDQVWAGVATVPAWLTHLHILRAEADHLAPTSGSASEDPATSRTADDMPPHDPADGDAGEPPRYEPRTAPLRRAEALRLLREHAPELEARFGVRLVALFGSVARDEARVDSDVDVLVEYVRPPGFREFLGSIDYLESLFRTRVDVGTLGALKERARPYVHRDMIRVA